MGFYLEYYSKTLDSCCKSVGRLLAIEQAESIARSLSKWAHPHIKDIIVYGSVARRQEDEWVHDIDMMILDDQMFSTIVNDDEYNVFCGLRKNLTSNLWDLMKVLGRKRGDLSGPWVVPVDLFVLPYTIFTSLQVRSDFLRKQRDPYFLKNVFSRVLIWEPDPRIQRFILLENPVGYFERKYSSELEDLRHNTR